MISVIILLCVGAAARTRQYTSRPPFWGDEAFIVMNLRERSPAQLVGRLMYDQASPPLFILGMKAMRAMFGEGELSLRFEPYAVSMLGLVFFGLLAWRAMPPPGALVAVGLFVFCRRLIEYVAETKQYGSDAAIASALLLIATGWSSSPPLRRLLYSTLAASVTVWFSHPTAIVFGGISLVLSVQCLRRSLAEALGAICCNALFAASLAVLYVVSIRPQHTDFLYDFWATSFPDWHHPLTFPAWLWRQFFEFLQTPYRWAAALFGPLIIGAILWGRANCTGERVAIWASPILLAIVAAMVQQYPFNGDRLTLFLMPSLFLLVGAGASWLWDNLPSPLRLTWWALPAALLGYGLMLTIAHMAHPTFRSYMRPAALYARAHARPTDAIVLLGEPSNIHPLLAYSARHLETLCYWPHPANPPYLGLDTFDDIHEERFWVLVAFSPGEVRKLEPLLRQARAQGDEIDEFIEPRGGAAYLFQRSPRNTTLPTLQH